MQMTRSSQHTWSVTEYFSSFCSLQLLYISMMFLLQFIDFQARSRF